ncbi:MAG: thiamine pyrophosphate-dependent enzyme [Spirochaetia bacterium]|jgi:indolepyruvate ferredoxin oxidoreductase alpha subunit|nr:thiamine pyrophosphate-dependent enzyme [Spirochaetia bacterium]
MQEVLVLGDEALALGAVDAGLSVAYGYPGTPSTEILEYLINYHEKKDPELIARWCTNEKTAFEGAVGVSYAGRRSLVTMKHVGLNVASDAFMNSALMKINGGLVVAVADDPGMHSSQNEQDSRFYADFARIICFEPGNHQEAYNMTVEAYRVSEFFHIPVMIKLVTRLSHSRAVIIRGETASKTNFGKAPERKDWMALPALSRKSWENHIKLQKDFEEYSEKSSFNKLDINSGRRDIAVITTGLGGNYYRENLSDLDPPPSHLHIGLYPAPVEKIRKLCGCVDKIIIIEEGYPFVERFVRGILPHDKIINGKMDSTVVPAGELDPDNVRKSLGLPPLPAQSPVPGPLPGRPPQLCAGCPHKDSFTALNEAVEKLGGGTVTSDIGCYALGAYPPYNAIETLLCMGASIGMARGAAESGLKNVVATIGDSTFLHSGITALIDAVSTDTPMTIMILDNSTTAMTGGQDTILSSARIKQVVLGCGVSPEHLREIIPLPKNHEKNVGILMEEIAHNGLSVIIPLRECVQTLRQKNKKSQ